MPSPEKKRKTELTQLSHDVILLQYWKQTIVFIGQMSERYIVLVQKKAQKIEIWSSVSFGLDSIHLTATLV